MLYYTILDTSWILFVEKIRQVYHRTDIKTFILQLGKKTLILFESGDFWQSIFWVKFAVGLSAAIRFSQLELRYDCRP